jgi:hypothetical protein
MLRLARAKRGGTGLAHGRAGMPTLPTPKWKLEDGFTPHWTPAPALARWPPLAWRATHRVRLGDNWLSIARDNLVPDVWDLIWFNFGTDDPRKVNWYLRH